MNSPEPAHSTDTLPRNDSMSLSLRFRRFRRFGCFGCFGCLGCLSLVDMVFFDSYYDLRDDAFPFCIKQSPTSLCST